MRVLMQSRVDLFDKRGGDTVQIEKTKGALEKIGVQVDIDLSTAPDLSDYDLVHLFNLDWCRETYLQAKNAKEQGRPVVLSAIHHSFEAIDRYEREARFGIRRLVNPVFRKWEQREFLKSIYRAVLDSRKRGPTLTQLRMGIKRQQQETLEMVDLILVQTEQEIGDIKRDFDLGRVAAGKVGPRGQRSDLSQPRFVKVVNGVSPDFATADPRWFVEQYGTQDFILSVGRIEPRKNQLAIIEAVSGLRSDLLSAGWRIKGGPTFQSASASRSSPHLVLVGKLNKLHPEYCWWFRQAVKKYDWVHHIPYIPYEKIGSAFAAARVHVLASWFETTGLVSLEAGLGGANVVSVRERCEEYLGDGAWYCDPGDTDSIARAVQEAYLSPQQTGLRERVLQNYTWEKVGKQTMEAYGLVTGNE